MEEFENGNSGGVSSGPETDEHGGVLSIQCLADRG